MRARLLYLAVLSAVIAIFASPAHASKDVVQFGSNIEIAPDATVHDTVCFFCSVNDRGSIEGDVVVFFGNVRIDGHANHDVVNFFGDVTASDNSSVGNDLVSFFGRVRLGENVSVGKDMVAMFGAVRTASTVNVGGDRVVQPGWLFWGPFLLLVAVIFVVVREVRAQRRRHFMRGYPFPPR
ncbi:hypothetical protein DYQ86_02615 [Acidobacteria bacterium AB60]|nr:hypothetical protein DYQ86_02615 [Acidobacteria bacterium AB60]